MKVISIINLKGGVGKTMSSINLAHIAATEYGLTTLLIDNDKQGNASKFFNIYGYENPSMADILTDPDTHISDAALNTKYKRLDILPANMRLVAADRQILLDVSAPQQTRLAQKLKADLYDYIFIDCAPDINMSTINALVASDEVLIPLSIDKFSMDGLGELLEQIERLKAFNPKLVVRGCFVTMYRKTNNDIGGMNWLRANAPLPVLNSYIRHTVKVGESTYKGQPLLDYAPNCTAAQDYLSLAAEII